MVDLEIVYLDLDQGAASVKAHLEEEIAGMRVPPFSGLPCLLQIFRSRFRVYELLVSIMTADIISIELL